MKAHRLALVMFLGLATRGDAATEGSLPAGRLLGEIQRTWGQTLQAPVRWEIDFTRVIRELGLEGTLDPHSLQIIPLTRSDGHHWRSPGTGSGRVPHRLEPMFGCDFSILHFVLPHDKVSHVAVYFDLLRDSKRAVQYPGLVGDGDRFVERFQRREINASHFDQFVDFDQDGDLDLFKGGVEPYVYCYENVGRERLEYRGRLTSGGRIMTLPHSQEHRSWLTVAFHDWDGDGDPDFFPSFNDGPDAGRIIAYQNTSPAEGGLLTLTRLGVLQTKDGTPLAGGDQAGGWFPSIKFVKDWDGDGGDYPDALVGSAHRCWLYRGLGWNPDGMIKFDQPEALRAGGREIELINPRFETADLDGDGNVDLLAGTQPGPIYWFRNRSAKGRPDLEAGLVLAYGGDYLIGDAHSGVTVADLDQDGLNDIVAGRFWERTELSDPEAGRYYGGWFRNNGSRMNPQFEPRNAWQGSPFTEGFQICDAGRQNGVRTVDWDNDGDLDLLAGDTDGFIWFFRNAGNPGGRHPARFSVFDPGEKLRAGNEVLSLASSGGHARLDVGDWNKDDRMDLVVADGQGTVHLFINQGSPETPRLAAGRMITAAGKPIQVGGRSSALVCDWNNDGHDDLVLAGSTGYFVCLNQGPGPNREPVLRPPQPIRFGGKPVSYVRPNLGSYVDWDGDGKKDLIGCHFENSVRFYRNLGTGAPGEEPRFSDPEGEIILRGESPQMISGAEVVDWDGDGRLDLLSGQGHGGSGLRFYARSWLDNESRGSHPAAVIRRVDKGRGGLDYLGVVRRYAEVMIDHGRDHYGPVKSGLLLSALDRISLEPLPVRPAPPGGIRRGDRPGRAWSAMNGANPMLDQNLLRVFYTLSELTSDSKYARVADEELTWFFEQTMSSATSLLPWGEHMSWDVVLDRPIGGGDDAIHEFARPWVLWERCFDLVPGPSRKFALGLWEHQIANHQTGGFDRHAPYFKHGPRDGRDFPRHASFYILTWCHAWRHTQDKTFLKAIRTLLDRFERKRVPKDGSKVATLGSLDLEVAASMVPESLAARLRKFAAEEDELIVPLIARQIEQGTLPRWQSGYAAGTLASQAMYCLERHAQTGKRAYRELLLKIAGAYAGSRPEEDVDVWPMAFAHVISTQVAAYRLTESGVYLKEADRLAEMAVQLFWQDKALPRASLQTGHYEAITGADSLALSLLEVHAATRKLAHDIPRNTIDR